MRPRDFQPAPPHPLRGWFFDRWLASEHGQHAAIKLGLDDTVQDLRAENAAL